jgi:hypothetical protein
LTVALRGAAVVARIAARAEVSAMREIRPFVSVAVVSLLPLAACSSSPEGGNADASARASPPESTKPVAALVGRWEESADVHTCESFVRGMNTEHLLAAVKRPALSVPGQTWQQVADDFCDPGPSDFGTEHSHFFDEFGNFGSVDEGNNQVDNGTYTIVNAHTMRIGESTFRYDVSGDSLVLDPVITKAEQQEALAKPGKFTEAVWMVAVAFPGTSWHRVACDGWC